MNRDSSESTYGSGYGSFRARLGEYQPLVDAALDSWDRQRFSELVWAKYPMPWKQPKGTPELVDRLGWLNVADTMLDRVEDLTSFAEEIRAEGITNVVVLGMGGSSLSPEVFHGVFGGVPGFPKLFVLDTTVPAAIRTLEAQIDLASTLFIVSSKSGETIETKSAYKYFFKEITRIHKKKACRQFIAIADPGSWLAVEAKAKPFRRRFLNMPDVGGRYSALSYFGLVPAALIGVDIAGLLRTARKMMEACGPEVPARDNPGVALGAIMAECALRGRDKLNMVFTPPMESLGAWIEQLIAESTGKKGQGVLPIEGEFMMPANVYPDDCLFVYTKPSKKGLKSFRSEEVPIPSVIDESDRRLKALADAGHPVVTMEIGHPLDLGGEYFRWEFASAVASAFLAVNAFNQPDVAAAKRKTREFLDEHKEKGEFRKLTRLAEDDNLTLYADDETKMTLDLIRKSGDHPDATPESMLRAHLQRIEPGNYLGVMAFIERTEEVESPLQAFRLLLRDTCNVPTTLGYGPRFLHSTGQFHKGGPNNGLFIQITAGDPEDVSIPGEDYSFAVLKDAQALGDFIALREKGRRIIRIHLRNDVLCGLVSLLDIAARIFPAP